MGLYPTKVRIILEMLSLTLISSLGLFPSRYSNYLDYIDKLLWTTSFVVDQ